MTLLPANLALTNIAPNAAILSADHRTNYSAIQAEANALLAILGAGAAGQLLAGVGNTVTWVYPPGYEPVAPQEITADATTASTTYVDLVTFAAATYENVKYYLEIVIPNLRNTGINSVLFQLQEGAGTIGNPAQIDIGSTAAGTPTFIRQPFTPSAASHTYKVTWKVTAGTGTVKVTSLAPAEFRIVKA